MKLIFLGTPGSGKSTQAKMLSERLECPYIEMGQLFRERASGEDESSKKIRESLEAGILVPDEIAVKALRDELSKEKYDKGFILDGYPRNNAQAEGLEENIDKVFYVKVSDEEAIKRLALRKREGETDEVLAKRLQTYHELTEPLLEKFKEETKLVEINGEQSIEEVYRTIEEKLKTFNINV